jgi:hypothetical protein
MVPWSWTTGNNNVRPFGQQFGHLLANVGGSGRDAVDDQLQVLALYPAETAQRFGERRKTALIIGIVFRQFGDKDVHAAQALALLRARRERPNGRTPNNTEKLPSPHARPRSGGRHHSCSNGRSIGGLSCSMRYWLMCEKGPNT